MPLYEYRCRVCDTSFQLLRAVRSADDPAPCPSGHTDVIRALSLVAPVRRGDVIAGPAPAPASGGGCCGGACGCGH